MLGGLLALNAGGVLPAAMAAAETAPMLREEFQPSEEFTLAVRAEHDRHRQQMEEIRQYGLSREETEREMGKEKEIHERNLREINHRFHTGDAHLAGYSR